MSDTQVVNGHTPEEQLPRLDLDRKTKVFAVAKLLRSNVYKLRVIWLEDVKSWGIICTAMIDGTLYDCINFLDDFTPHQHADMFRAAFSDALKQVEKDKKKLVTLH